MLSRALGAVPIVMHGIWGTPMPHRVPMAVVIGKALQVRRVGATGPQLQRPSDAWMWAWMWMASILLYANGVCVVCTVACGAVHSDTLALRACASVPSTELR